VFPAKDPLFGNKRYWPAVRAFLDARSGLTGLPPRVNLNRPTQVNVWLSSVSVYGESFYKPLRAACYM
jgi:hypothetical protein